MKMARRFLFGFIGLGLLVEITSCSTASVRVMPGENVNRAVARDIERDDAEEAAVKAAEKYCRKRSQEAVFVTDRTQYTGKMDEQTRSIVRKGSQAAMILGGIGTFPRETRAPGAVLGSAGTVGTVMTSERDYESSVEFKCVSGLAR